MKKLILIATIIFKILIIIFLIILTFKKSPQNQLDTNPTITTEPSDNRVRRITPIPPTRVLFPSSLTPTPGTGWISADANRLKSLLPYASADFSLSYSDTLQKFILNKLSRSADAAFETWLESNNLSSFYKKNASLFLVKTTLTSSSGTPSEDSYVNLAMERLTNTQRSQLETIKQGLPYSTPSFSVRYSKQFDTFIIEKKTADADKDINEWARSNGLSTTVHDQTIFVNITLTSTNTDSSIAHRILHILYVAQNQVVDVNNTLQSIGDAFASVLKTVSEMSKTNPELAKYFITPTVAPPSSSGTSTPGSDTSGSSVNDVLGLIQSYGLPPPIATGEKGYTALKAKLEGDPRALWSAKSFLQGEKNYEAKGGKNYRYLTTSWVWFENGVVYPDLYEINCDDKWGLKQVSLLCAGDVANPSSRHYHNFQIAGYQAADKSNDYVRIYRLFYGDADVKSVMQKIVDNSRNAMYDSQNYLHSSQQTGLVAKYLPNGQIPSGISISDIAPNASDKDHGFFNEKTQFYTLILGKDPNIAASFNAITVHDIDNMPERIFKQPIGSANRPRWANYINATAMQLMSNMIAALYLIDTGRGNLDAVQALSSPSSSGGTSTGNLATSYPAVPNKPYYSGNCGSVNQMISVFADNATAGSCWSNVKSAVERNLVTINLLGKNVPVNKKAQAAFQAVNDELSRYRVNGSTYKFAKGEYTFKRVETQAFRCNVNSSGSQNLCSAGCKLSNHSFGTAVDINPDTNANGSSTFDMPPEVVDAFERHGFRWGGRYKAVFNSTIDPMHFEYMEILC
jgi:hypothetical protein